MNNSKLDIAIEVREPEACSVVIDIDVAAPEVEKAIKKSLQGFKGEVEVPGFRKGKTPLAIIKKRFATQINEKASEKLIQDAVQQAIAESNVEPLTAPQIENEDSVKMVEGKNFIFTVSFDVTPKFEMPKYKGLSIKTKSASVSDEDVEIFLGEWLKSRGTLAKVDAPAKANDMLKVSYKGTLSEEQEISDSAATIIEAENSWLALREPEVLPGVTEQLIGAEAGKTIEATIDFPADFAEESLRGKSATYSIVVAEVHTTVAADLTDDLAKEMGSESAEQLKNNIKNHMTSQAKEEQRADVRTKLVSLLLNQVDMDTPPRMLQRESYEIAQQIFEREHRNGMSEEELNKKSNEFFAQAKEQAKNTLKRKTLFGKIANLEDVSVSKEEMDSTIQYISRQHQQKPEELMRTLTQNGRIYELMEDMRISKAIELVADKAEIIEE